MTLIEIKTEQNREETLFLLVAKSLLCSNNLFSKEMNAKVLHFCINVAEIQFFFYKRTLIGFECFHRNQINYLVVFKCFNLSKL